jgi:hypothetical protein
MLRCLAQEHLLLLRRHNNGNATRRRTVDSMSVGEWKIGPTVFRPFEHTDVDASEMMSLVTLWMVRAGRRGEGENDALSGGAVGIGWPEVGNLASLTTAQGIRNRLNETYPDAKLSTLANWAGQIDAFRFRIKGRRPRGAAAEIVVSFRLRSYQRGLQVCRRGRGLTAVPTLSWMDH